MRKRSGRRGQAIVEFLLMVAMALFVVTAIGVGFRKSIVNLWLTFTREIAAACPSCPPPDQVK